MPRSSSTVTRNEDLGRQGCSNSWGKHTLSEAAHLSSENQRESKISTHTSPKTVPIHMRCKGPNGKLKLK